MDCQFRNTKTFNELILNQLNKMRINLDLAVVHYLITQSKPRRILEIGFNQGLTFGAMVEAAPADAELTAIDIILDLEQFYQRYPETRNSSRVKIIKISSDDFDDNSPYDFVNVDGDHTLPRQFTDIVKGARLLSRNGILMIDDWRNPDVSQAIDQFLALDTGLVPFLKSVQSVFFHYPEHNAIGMLNNFYEKFNSFCNIVPQDEYKSFCVTNIDSMRAVLEHNDVFQFICKKFEI